jgi:hypothetical protein
MVAMRDGTEGLDQFRHVDERVVGQRLQLDRRHATRLGVRAVGVGVGVV